MDRPADPLEYVRAGSWLLIPFSLLWGGFAVFWEVTAIVSGAPVFFWLWGIPFVLVGLYMIFGRFIVAARIGRRTLYALTDRRIIIVSGLRGLNVTSLWLASLPQMQVTEGADGVGTITFRANPYQSWTGSGWPSSRYAAPSFAMIERVSDVARAIDEARSHA